MSFHTAEVDAQEFLEAPRFPFPVGKKERERWDIVHAMLTLKDPTTPAAGKKRRPYYYSAAAATAVESALGTDEDNKVILDIGTGTGIWATAMSDAFTKAKVVGIDLIPPEANSKYPNVSFQSGNANLTLNFKDATIDVVHARMLDHGIRVYPNFLSEVARVLRKDGVFLVAIGIAAVFDKDGIQLPTASIGDGHYNGLQTLLTATSQLVYSRRGAPITRNLWETWMGEQKGNDKSYFKDATRNADIVQKIGPAVSEGAADTAGSLAMQDVRLLIQSMRATLLRADPAQKDAIDQWVTDATAYLDDQNSKPLSARWASAYCIRTDQAFISPT